MAKTTSFILGDHFEQFIASQISSGRFGSASEVLRASLRLMEQEEQKLEALRAHLDEGIAELDRGEGTDGKTFFDELLGRTSAGE